MDFATTILICKDAYLRRKKGTSTEKFDTFSQTTHVLAENKNSTLMSVNMVIYLLFNTDVVAHCY